VAKGGARPGAGRKKGGQNRLTKAQLERAEKIAAEAAASGKLPHQILFDLGRGEQVKGFGKLRRGERIDCLKASAQFYAPKMLGAVVRTNPDEQNPWAQILGLVQDKSRGLPAEASKRARTR
jgi:hypothetical protein